MIENKSKPLGIHILAELHDCDFQKLDDLVLLENAIIKAVEIAGASLVDTMFHKFSPQGVTGIALIMESHLSIHTWPENNYAAVDFFSCNHSMKITEAIEHISTMVNCKNLTIKNIDRGISLSPVSLTK